MSKITSDEIEKAVLKAVSPKKSLGRVLLELWVAVIIQVLVAAVCFTLIFELILPLADGFYAAEGSIRDYLVYGLATVPLRIIFK